MKCRRRDDFFSDANGDAWKFVTPRDSGPRRLIIIGHPYHWLTAGGALSPEASYFVG